MSDQKQGEIIEDPTVDDDPTHDPTRARGEDFAEPSTEHEGPANRPVGQVEGDLMEPNNAPDGTSDVK